MMFCHSHDWFCACTEAFMPLACSVLRSTVPRLEQMQLQSCWHCHCDTLDVVLPQALAASMMLTASMPACHTCALR